MNRYEQELLRKRQAEGGIDRGDFGSGSGRGARGDYGSGIGRSETGDYGESDDGYDAVLIEEDQDEEPSPLEPDSFGSDQGIYVHNIADNDVEDEADLPHTANGYEMTTGGFYQDAPLSRSTLGGLEFGDKVISYRGIGPGGYRRSDQRIYEDICDALSADPQVNAADISVEVVDAEATLEGTIDNRSMKHLAEDIAASCPGIVEVHNRLRVRRQHASENTARSDQE